MDGGRWKARRASPIIISCKPNRLCFTCFSRTLHGWARSAACLKFENLQHHIGGPGGASGGALTAGRPRQNNQGPTSSRKFLLNSYWQNTSTANVALTIVQGARQALPRDGMLCPPPAERHLVAITRIPSGTLCTIDICTNAVLIM